MTYFVTKGGYTVDENNIIIPMDESSPLYQEYLIYILGGNSVYPTDFITQAEIDDGVVLIRKEYSERISNIEGLQEAIERKLIDGTDIPQELLDKRVELKNEYLTRIMLFKQQIGFDTPNHS
jgi:hypothetical protein